MGLHLPYLLTLKLSLNFLLFLSILGDFAVIEVSLAQLELLKVGSWREVLISRCGYVGLNRPKYAAKDRKSILIFVFLGGSRPGPIVLTLVRRGHMEWGRTCGLPTKEDQPNKFWLWKGATLVGLGWYCVGLNWRV